MRISVKWVENKRRPEGSVELVGALEIKGAKAWPVSLQVVKHPSGWTMYGLEPRELYEYHPGVGLDQVLIRTCETIARRVGRGEAVALARHLRAFAKSRTVGA